MKRRMHEMTPTPLSEMSKPEQDLEQRFGKYGYVVMPNESEPPILTGPVRAALHQWLWEMNAADELEAAGLKPRTRAILSGPPGCGKTTLAHHIAARLGLPLVVVQSQQVVESSLGGSGRNIAGLFREARRGAAEAAIFFDEFDALAKVRRGVQQACDAETNNITISLLQEMDRFDGLLFAATNLTGDIDPAIWRRFQIQIEIGFPGDDERFAIVKRYLSPFAVEDQAIHDIADVLRGASPALIREACEGAKRSLVLGKRMGLDNSLPAIFTRFAASAAPADDMPTPILWDDPRSALTQLASAPWPPVPLGQDA
ncbi:ATP-binding protein [Sphingomonas paucimobilis]|uniref:ATP-binding protein n=1 Tax=Sphingomonas paucimobilis TaxID=13689 RepID=UPI000B04E464|nr:ATP-binding protein [Sphingomonas paucimobilis]